MTPYALALHAAYLSARESGFTNFAAALWALLLKEIERTQNQ